MYSNQIYHLTWKYGTHIFKKSLICFLYIQYNLYLILLTSASCTLYSVYFFVLYFVFYILYTASCILHPVSCFSYSSIYILYLLSSSLYPVTCILNPVSSILFPVSSILYLNPASYVFCIMYYASWSYKSISYIYILPASYIINYRLRKKPYFLNPGRERETGMDNTGCY